VRIKQQAGFPKRLGPIIKLLTVKAMLDEH
jgi:hypothetical protein